MKQSLVVLDPVQHKKLTFSPLPIYPHAINLTKTTLLYSEFVQASHSYPILFFQPKKDGQIVAVAMLDNGESGTNQFIDQDSCRWNHGDYIPASVAIYPFYPGPKTESGEQKLLIDPDAPQFATKNGTPLFTEDGVPSPTLNKIINRFADIKKDQKKTDQLIELLIKASLLKNKNLVSNTEEYGKIILDEYFVLDPQLLNNISDKQLLLFNKRGILPHLYSVTSSIGNLNKFANPEQPEPVAATTQLAPHKSTINPALNVKSSDKLLEYQAGIIAISFIGTAILSGLLGYLINSNSEEENRYKTTSQLARAISGTEQKGILSKTNKSLPTEPIRQCGDYRKPEENKKIAAEQVAAQKNPVEIKAADLKIIKNEPNPPQQLTLPAPQDLATIAKNQIIAEQPYLPVDIDAAHVAVIVEKTITKVPQLIPATSDSVPIEEEAGKKPVEMVEQPDSDRSLPKPSRIKDSQAKKIELLVAQARDNIQAARLSNPRGDNALEKIRTIESIDPYNPIVQILLEDVFKRYLKLATWSPNKKARVFLNRAESILPGDRRVEETRKIIANRDKKRQ
ncbi:MAG: SapC family protein [Magnetococcales bacterium]|nr:SapC family protein [Magnetococcales bacterium]